VTEHDGHEPDASVAGDMPPESAIGPTGDTGPEAVPAAAADAPPESVPAAAADAPPESVPAAAADAPPESVPGAVADAPPESVPAAAPDAAHGGADPASAGARNGLESQSAGRPHEHPRSHSERNAARVEQRLRARCAGLVAVMLIAVLVAGALVRVTPSRATNAGASGQLPIVTLSSHSAVQWNCPGPLPAGASPARSTVIVANPAGATARVLVDVEAVSAVGVPLPAWTTRLSLAPRSEQVVPLHTSGPVQSDAVSVLSVSGAVAVFESVVPARTRVIHRRRVPRPTAPAESPCSTGTATSSYLASGSTKGRSDVIVSLFDPSATQAVVGIRVATASVSVSPPALQGLIVKPYSLQVFNIARWVVQQGPIAIAVTTTAGRVALGAAETVASDTTSTTSTSGQALFIGLVQPRDEWVLTPGLGTTRRSISLRVYDPGSRAASVTISVPVIGAPPIEITAEVPAGEVRAIDLPSSTAPGAKAPKGSASQIGPVVLRFEGPITVRTAEGVGIVVSRTAVLTTGHHYQTVAFSEATSLPAKEWVVPASESRTAVSGGVVISNPGRDPVEVEVIELSTDAGAPITTTLTVPNGATMTAAVHLSASERTVSGILIVAGGLVVAEQDFYAVGTPNEVVPVAPGPVDGIPVVG
jgi:hypothetical protein